MPGESIEGFADNWTYLKTELNWLDRVLMVAVARQRKEGKEVDRVAQSRADRATSHWWKGILSLEGTIAYDEYRKPSLQGSGSKQSYQQQLEARIQASQQQGIRLALPILCDRLELTVFEKNLVLMSLAPEVNRRYAQIYRYLQSDDSSTKMDLPTVDLVLRLLCRNDQEWRTARNRLMSSSPLVQHKLLKILPRRDDTPLNYPLKLNRALVDYLLAEHPTVDELDNLLASQPPTRPAHSFLYHTTPTVDWSALILPPSLLASLQFLCQTVQWQSQVDEDWGFKQSPSGIARPNGVVALVVGRSGTGKTMAAGAIAHTLQTPLVMVDLSLVEPETYDLLLQDIATQAPKILLIKSAHLWLRRSALVSDAQIHQFLQQRRSMAGITLCSVPTQATVRLYWQQRMDRRLTFPLPDEGDRLHLWKQAFPSQVPLESEIDWQQLAHRARLTGGEIGAIARTATLCLAASQDPELGMKHILQALNQHGK